MIRELLLFCSGPRIVVVGQAVEVNGGFHILIRTHHRGILGFHFDLFPCRTVNNVCDFLAAVPGIGSTEVQVNKVLVNERETSVHIQQVFMGGT